MLVHLLLAIWLVMWFMIFNQVVRTHCPKRKLEPWQLFTAKWFCNREKPNQTTCWICFFCFNLCFPLLLFTKRILSIHNGLPQGTLPLCLNVKPKCLCSGKQPTLFHLWMAGCKKEEINTSPPPRLAIPGDICKKYGLFYFTSSSPPPLCAIKEAGIQIPIR